MKHIVLMSVFSLLFTIQTFAANRLKPYDDYILQYGEIALRQQQKYGIPASITLAQGLLESGAGKSEMALESNNHFGIKCHNNWDGETVTYFDDGVNSCFRKYKQVEDSYEDHSKFLVNGARYRGLFMLEPHDYEGWAKGLQKAGYATDPNYAEKLIKIIKTYELEKISAKTIKKHVTAEEKEPKKQKKQRERKVRVKDVKERVDTTKKEPLFTEDLLRNAKDYHGIVLRNEGSAINPVATHVINYVATTPCVTAKFGDSFGSLSEEFGISARSIIKCNDFPENYKLTPGEVVYLDKKNTWWDGEKPYHMVKDGETMLIIAQKYALQLKALYKLNDMNISDKPVAGQRIKLRNPDQMSNFVRIMNDSYMKTDTTTTK
jgi:LysM repeat protein